MEASPSKSKTVPTTNATNIHIEVSKWFKDEEFYWRSLASYVWLVMMFPPVFGLYTLCVNVSLLSPVQWMIGSFTVVFSLPTVAIIVLLQSMCVLFTVPHARGLSVQKITQTSKLKFTLFLLRPKQFLNVICFVSASFLMCSILKQFGDTISSSNSTFLSCFGIFLGVFYAVTYYKDHAYVTEFPIIQQTRFFRLKKKINSCCLSSLMFSLKALQIYYPLYIITGLLREESLFGTISNLCSVSLFLTCFCISMVITFMLKISNILVEIFNTQVYTFPLVPSFTEQQNRTLADAMESKNVFLKHLACLDYNTLSIYEGARRLKMFELSPPGSQAHCWNRTCSESLKIIYNMRSLLTKEHERKQFLKLGNTMHSATPKVIGSQELFSAEPDGKERLLEQDKSWLSPGKLFQLSSKENVSDNKDKVVPKAVTTPSVDVFEHLQITLWCLEGLCNLVAASIKEDKYGVVQQKLPDILAELLYSLEACEEFSKSSFNVPSFNHTQHVEAAQINNSHATSLKLALKTGLYTITTAFGYHITNVRLIAVHKKRLHGFLEFAE